MKEKEKALVVVEKMELGEEKKEAKPKAVVDTGKDYHAILGVASDATEKEIKAAFKKLAEKYHPDKVRHLGKEIIDVAARNMRELNEARDALMKRLKEGPEPSEDGGADEAILSAKEEATSLPVQGIVAEDRLLGQGEEAPEGEATDEEKSGEGTVEAVAEETEEGEVKESVTGEGTEEASAEKTEESEPHEPVTGEEAKEPEADVVAEGPDVEHEEPTQVSDDIEAEESDEPGEVSTVDEPEEISTVDEPEMDTDSLFASLDDDDLPPPEDAVPESTPDEVWDAGGDSDDDDLDDLIKNSDDLFGD